MAARPDYLVVGHVSKDLLPGGGAQAGGTVTYASIAAQRLGLQAAVVTSLSAQDEPLLAEMKDEGVQVCALPSESTTTFRNDYAPDGARTQMLLAHASPIGWGDIPLEWRGTPIVHLGPVAQELSCDLPSRFIYCLLGITPQGWMRHWGGEGWVAQAAWPIPPPLESLPANTCLVMSMEDLAWDEGVLAQYARLASTVAVTQAAGDTMLFVHAAEAISYIPPGEMPSHILHPSGGKSRIDVPALEASVIDPTGAGDVFAAAFLVRLSETNNPVSAARFAHAAAAFAIEGQGIAGIADRVSVTARAARQT